MGDKLVTDLSPETGEGGGASRQPSFRYNYGEKFEDLCGYYMSIGMSYHDYWDGDCCMTKYYRQMDTLKREHRNEELWLQGAYVYEALLCAAPLYAFKPTKPTPYRETPIPLTERERERTEENEKDKKMKNGRDAMHIFATNFNLYFNEKQRKEGKVNGDSVRRS